MSNIITLPQPKKNAGAEVGTHVPDTSQKQIPDFISRHDINAMSDDELDDLTAAIQARRLRPIEIFKQAQAEKIHAIEEKLQAQIDKKCEQIIKTIDTLNKNDDKLLKQIHELRALRLQAGATNV